MKMRMCCCWKKSRISSMLVRKLPGKGCLGGPCLSTSSWKDTLRRISQDIPHVSASLVGGGGGAWAPWGSLQNNDFFCLARRCKMASLCIREFTSQTCDSYRSADIYQNGPHIDPWKVGLYMWDAVPVCTAAPFSPKLRSYTKTTQSQINRQVIWNTFIFVSFRLRNSIFVEMGAVFSSLACFTLNRVQIVRRKSPHWSRVTCFLAFSYPFGIVKGFHQMLLPKVIPYSENVRPWAHKMA